jgi:hypothetical protein
MSKIAVIIVSWNCRESLSRCLKSLKEHGPPGLEIIVVDNASVDGTGQEIPLRFPDIHFLPQEKNLGFAAANNIGVSVTKADYLFFLNPDTFIKPRAIEILQDFMEKTPRCALAAPTLFDTKGNILQSIFRFPSLWNYWTEHSFFLPLRERLKKLFLRKDLPFTPDFKPCEIDWATGAAILVRRNALEGESVFDERYFMYSEDADLCKRLSEQGWKRYLLPDAQVVHSHRQSSIQARARTIFHLFHSMTIYYAKYKGPAGNFSLRLSIFIDMLLRIIILKIIPRKSASEENRERLKGYKSVLSTLSPFRRDRESGDV